MANVGKSLGLGTNDSQRISVEATKAPRRGD